MSQNTFALSPAYTEPNYIWRTPNTTNWFLQNQGRVNLKNYLFSGIGQQYIGRYQFAFPSGIGNLSDNTVLTIEMALKHQEAPGVIGGGGTNRGWGKSLNARINIGNSTSGYCNVRKDSFVQVTIICEYVWDTPSVNLSSIWLDVGNFAVENGGNPWGNPNGDYLFYGSTFWVEYINYYYQTGLSASSQAIINAINNSNSTLINQNSQIIQGQNNIWQQNQDYYDEQYGAYDNISNQSEGDIQNSQNQQTTNLIGVITSFFGELSSFQATSCLITLPFPSFIGGNQSVNICQGKDVLGNFITVFSTLTAIMFYIPLAWILLKMIYSEIRSWTNG